MTKKEIYIQLQNDRICEKMAAKVGVKSKELRIAFTGKNTKREDLIARTLKELGYEQKIVKKHVS